MAKKLRFPLSRVPVESNSFHLPLDEPTFIDRDMRSYESCTCPWSGYQGEGGVRALIICSGQGVFQPVISLAISCLRCCFWRASKRRVRTCSVSALYSARSSGRVTVLFGMAELFAITSPDSPAELGDLGSCDIDPHYACGSGLLQFSIVQRGEQVSGGVTAWAFAERNSPLTYCCSDFAKLAGYSFPKWKEPLRPLLQAPYFGFGEFGLEEQQRFANCEKAVPSASPFRSNLGVDAK